LAASGRTSLPRILLTSTVLVGAGLSGATLLDPTFGLLLVGYIVVTLAYSLHFKRIAIADIFVLAFLYLSRVIAGILISEARVSFWLFGFTFLLFLSLAAAKRFVELQQTRERGDDDIAGRGYRAGDLGMVSALGVSTGVASCIVLALYSNSPQVSLLYARHEWIWGLCVIGLYWITRIWFLAHRGRMHDDPVVFALKDRSTWCLTLAGLLCVILAQPVPS
jgi:4-hydroxybenzoate polyprenyltransferase